MFVPPFRQRQKTYATSAKKESPLSTTLNPIHLNYAVARSEMDLELPTSYFSSLDIQAWGSGGGIRELSIFLLNHLRSTYILYRKKNKKE